MLGERIDAATGVPVVVGIQGHYTLNGWSWRFKLTATISRHRSSSKIERRVLPANAYRGFAFHGLKALSSSSPFIANATDRKCREITDFIEFSSTQSMPGFV